MRWVGRRTVVPYRFVAQLLDATVEKRRLADACGHVAHHIEVEVRMQRHVLVEATLLGRLRIADACGAHECGLCGLLIGWLGAVIISTRSIECGLCSAVLRRVHFCSNYTS